MGLLDNYTGIGMSPRPRGEHQDIIVAIIGNIYLEYRDEYIIRGESCIDPNNLNSPAPDIIIFDRDTDKPVLFIEVTTTEEADEIGKKIIELLVVYPFVKEAFMYDYELKTWKRFANHYIDHDSFSEVLKISLNHCLKSVY